MKNLTLTIEQSKGELTKLLYTVAETAHILSMSIKSIRRLLERGLLKANPALRVKLITRDSIQTFSRM